MRNVRNLKATVAVLLTFAALFGGTGAGASTQTTASASRAGTGRAGAVTLGMMGGLATTGGDYGGNFLAGVLVNVDRSSPVYMGLESGILFGSGMGLPILASLFYMPMNSTSLTPYVGGTIGPVIGLSGLGAFRGADGVRLAIWLRPGLRARVASALDINIETAVGGLTGIFYISPSLGVRILL